jgi:hypothetical protein
MGGTALVVDCHGEVTRVFTKTLRRHDDGEG